MRKLPLERVEKLVEASVFHPSPCKRLKERVLRDAVRATVRQDFSRRMLAMVAAGVVVMALGIFVVRIARAPSDVPSPGGVPSANAQPGNGPIQGTPGGSLGEGLYQSDAAIEPAPAPPGN